MDPFSLKAWDEINKEGWIGERQMKVLRIFLDCYPEAIPGSKVVEIIGRGVSECNRNRITELVDLGYIEKKGSTKCPVTKREVNLFCWTGRTKPKVKVLTKIVCPCCHGAGEIKKEVFMDNGEAGQLSLL
jgi:hypothetical protein